MTVEIFWRGQNGHRDESSPVVVMFHFSTMLLREDFQRKLLRLEGKKLFWIGEGLFLDLITATMPDRIFGSRHPRR